MVNKDFQNGYALGLISGTTTEKIIQKTITVSSGIAEVMLPVAVDPVIAEINNGNIEIETSVAIEIAESEE
jgi:hypothetical protein